MKVICIALFLFSLPGYAEEGPPLPDDAARIRESYGRELNRVLVPLHAKYVRALEGLKRDYTRIGNLEAALQIDAELRRANLWESLPLPKPDPASTQHEFAEWLNGRSFSFSGVSNVTLQFGEDTVKWTTQGGEKEHPFEVNSKRAVTIEGAQDFKLKFAEDLTSGTFSSDVGTYDLKFVGP